MVMKAGKHHRSTDKQATVYVRRSLTLHIIFYAHWLCMNYIIAILLLVSCMNTHNHLLYFPRFCAGSTRKIARKTHNKELLTMVSDTPELSLSRSKIANPMIPELIYSRILNIKRGALHTKRFRCIPLSVSRYRLMKNGFADLKSFRGFWETGP